MPLILLGIAGAVTAVLALFAGGYGYHRDELYFIAAGKRLDWAYADQGPVTPLIARAMTELAPDSLTVLRLPSALAAGLIVLLTGLLARELAEDGVPWRSPPQPRAWPSSCCSTGICSARRRSTC